jgi:hypothetical protein
LTEDPEARLKVLEAKMGVLAQLIGTVLEATDRLLNMANEQEHPEPPRKLHDAIYS